MEFLINGILWEIEYVHPMSEKLLRSDRSRTVGVTDLSKGMIYINSMLSGEFLRKVITHEVCHASMFSYGIFVDIETEELICDFIASNGREIFEIADELFRVIKNVAW